MEKTTFVDQLAAVADYDRLHAHARAMSAALQQVRPVGGSELLTRIDGEYWADAEKCGAEITVQRKQLHKAKVENIKLKREVAELKAANIDLLARANGLKSSADSAMLMLIEIHTALEDGILGCETLTDLGEIQREILGEREKGADGFNGAMAEVKAKIGKGAAS